VGPHPRPPRQRASPCKARIAGDANQVLERCLPRHNRRFMVAAQDPDPAWMPWPKNRRFDEFFCFKYRHVVGNDNTVRFGPPSSTSLPAYLAEFEFRFSPVCPHFAIGAVVDEGQLLSS
jgi:hypothetical protein